MSHINTTVIAFWFGIPIGSYLAWGAHAAGISLLVMVAFVVVLAIIGGSK